jgi:hypothetical protein
MPNGIPIQQQQRYFHSIADHNSNDILDISKKMPIFYHNSNNILAKMARKYNILTDTIFVLSNPTPTISIHQRYAKKARYLGTRIFSDKYRSCLPSRALTPTMDQYHLVGTITNSPATTSLLRRK